MPLMSSGSAEGEEVVPEEVMLEPGDAEDGAINTLSTEAPYVYQGKAPAAASSGADAPLQSGSEEVVPEEVMPDPGDLEDGAISTMSTEAPYVYQGKVPAATKGGGDQQLKAGHGKEVVPEEVMPDSGDLQDGAISTMSTEAPYVYQGKVPAGTEGGGDQQLKSGHGKEVIPDAVKPMPGDADEGGINTQTTEAPYVFQGKAKPGKANSSHVPLSSGTGEKVVPKEVMPKPGSAGDGGIGTLTTEPPYIYDDGKATSAAAKANGAIVPPVGDGSEKVVPEKVVPPLGSAVVPGSSSAVIADKDSSEAGSTTESSSSRPHPADDAYLKPLESRHDGNVCDTEEELWGGLCYRRCALLTGGQRPIRKGPWTCCNHQPCNNIKQVAEKTLVDPVAAAKMCLGHCDGSFGSSVICNGYDISGDGSCPHKPGACLTDEELYLGICYKKCTLLTNGTHPYRSAPATCCSEKSELRCMKAGASITDAAFNTGGGAGDSAHDASARSHLPDQALTEASGQSNEQPKTTSSPPTVNFDDSAQELHDGNVCADTEEIYAGLCYRKCSLLTNGAAGIRTSAWSCCKDHPCGLRNEIMAPGPPMFCHGFGVSADGSCPHKPGTCFPDEELHLGICYKKCELLTGNKFPHRFSGIECCDTTGLGCMLPSHIKLSKGFAVGGDANGGSQAHAPMESLTEVDDGEDRQSSSEEDLADGDQPALWQVTVDGRVNVRRRPDVNALVIDVKKHGAVFRGRRHGNWLQLQDQAGFIEIKYKTYTLVTQVNSTGAP